MANYRDGNIAAYYGYLAILQNNDHLQFTSNAMYWAALKGHLEIIKFLHENLCAAIEENGTDIRSISTFLGAPIILQH